MHRDAKVACGTLPEIPWLLLSVQLAQPAPRPPRGRAMASPVTRHPSNCFGPRVYGGREGGPIMTSHKREVTAMTAVWAGTWDL